VEPSRSPKPVKDKARPPCPSDGAPPPGHDKGDGGDRPCSGKGKDNGDGNGNGDGRGKDGGFVLVLPLTVSTVAWATRPTRPTRPARLRSRRPTR
jgi:hypothetical protein